MTIHRINLDEYTIPYYHLKNNNKDKFNNTFQDIIEFINILENDNSKIKEFQFFLKKIISPTEKSQSNNHTYMECLLKERKNTHKRLDYDKLKIIDKFNDIPYSNSISADSIVSNKYVTNETEKLLNVSILETKFLDFTRSNKFKIDSNDKDFIELKEYFALQMTRRENFLYITVLTLIDWFKEYFKTEDIDLLDYLYIKFYYNKALMQNYKNWLVDMNSYNSSIFQIEYCNIEGINWSDAKKINHIPINANEVYLALNESHTFIFKDFFNAYDKEFINQLLIDNTFDIISESEIYLSSKVYVTLGCKNKLCFIIPIQMTQTTFDKYNFIIHALWDNFMAHGTYRTLLLSEKTELDINFFKKLAQNTDVILKNKNLTYLYAISKKYEVMLKK